MNKSILIIAVPRSGSTSLLNSFKKYKLFCEPLNDSIKDGFTTKSFFNLIKNKNIVIKTMSDHAPSDWEGTNLSFNLSIIPYFDYVILLDRKDISQQEQSYHRILDADLEIKDEFTPKLRKNAIKYLYLQKYLLRELADNLDLDITYYEDIFYGDSKIVFKNLKINLDTIDFDLLNSNHRYTKNIHFSKPKTIL